MRRPFHYLPALDERARPCVVKGVVNGRRGQWLGFYVFGSASNGEAQELVLHARWLSEDWMSAMSRARRMARNAKRRFPAGAGNGLFSADTEGNVRCDCRGGVVALQKRAHLSCTPFGIM